MTPEELLAVWAHRPEDLDADERAEVEALFARDPSARADAEAMRAMLVDVRAMPMPSPPASLARDVAAAVDRAAASPWARLRAWILRPAIAIGVAAAATAAVGLWIAKRDTDSATAVHPTIDAGAPIAHAPPPIADVYAAAPATSGELADLEGLDDHALDALAANLDDELGDAAPTPAPASEDEVLPEPDLGWVDELSSSDVDKLDHYLETHRSPT